MKHRLVGLARMLLVLGLLSLAQARAGEAGVSPPAAAPSCGSAAQTRAALQQRTVQARAMLEALTDFVSGRATGEVPAASLFTVNLADDDAVARRVAALQQLLARDPKGAAASDPLARCAAGDPALAALASALGELQARSNRLRLEFLLLPRPRRDALINAQQSLIAHIEKASDLARDERAAERQQSAATQSVETAELQARSAATMDLRELATQRALLEKAREDLADVKLRFSSQLRSRAGDYQQIASRLSGLAGSLTQSARATALLEAYADTAVIWRDLVDQIFERIADPNRYEPIPALPAVPQALLDRLGSDAAAQAYRMAAEAARVEHAELASLRRERFAQERNSVFRLLLAASRLRSELLRENIEAGNTQVSELNSVYLADLYREIRVVPYRLYAFATTKFLDFRDKARSGISGLMDIVWQLLIFALFIAVPFGVYYAMRWAAGKLRHLRDHLIREQVRLPEQRRRTSRIATQVIHRINTYLPWIVMLLGIWLANRLVADTVFAEVSTVLPYLSYFVWFRIFVLLSSGLLGVIAYTGTMQGLTARSHRIKRMARRVGIFFFTALALLHAVQDVVGQALVYQLVVSVMLYLGAVILALATRSWREEIVAAGRHALPAWAADRLERYCAGWLSYLLCLPAMVLVMASQLLRQIASWAGEADWFKQIGAELFRRRVEGVTPDTRPQAGGKALALPADYLAAFDLGVPTDMAMLIEPTSGIVADVMEAVLRWKDQPAGEHSMAITGDKGTGKSSLLKIMERECKDCRIVRFAIPPRLLTRDEVLAFFSAQLGCDLSAGGQGLGALDAPGVPTLILVDEAQNLFLGEVGGFEGYRTFMELVNSDTTSLFWCAAFNRRSWDYLRGVYGAFEYFQNVLPVPPMTDEDIQNLILSRHRRTGFTLTYDSIIRATQSADDISGLAHIETQFFRLLWGQSKGNPRAAMVLWLSALQASGNKRLRVSIPSHKPIQGLDKVDDDALFVYAAIVRHENLSAEEAIRTTSLSHGQVHEALRLGIDSKVIARGEDGRYRPTPTAQFSLIQLLMGKNFVHE